MSIEAQKFGLSCNDTKRYIIPDGEDMCVGTLAFGHKDIKKYEAMKPLKEEADAFTPPPTPKKRKVRVIDKQPQDANIKVPSRSRRRQKV